MFEDLMSINAAAFAENDFATAYHALASARHRAAWAKDIDQLRSVADIADRQCRELDERAPNHPLSSRSAAARGNRSIFAVLVNAAQSSLLLIKHGQREQELASLMDVARAPAN
jgi:hypothetical protein